MGDVADDFYNPYYAAPAVGSTAVYNYSEPVYVESQPVYVESQPVVVQTPAAAPVASPTLPEIPQPEAPADPPAAAEDPKVKEAGALFDGARDAFKSANYSGALQQIDKAIQVLPNDAALHEFRSLVLFAEKKYTEAAGVIYSVLAVGPGWTWDTVKALYNDPKSYEAQLRGLEAFVKANPKDAASRFLLSYHYLVLDQREQAVKLLNEVVAMNPKDKLSEAMAKAISQSLEPAVGDKPKVQGT